MYQSAVLSVCGSGIYALRHRKPLAVALAGARPAVSDSLALRQDDCKASR